MLLSQPMNEYEHYLSLWDLQLDGDPIITPSSHLFPVLYQHQSAMLKIALCEEESNGGKLMIRWNGQGAARIFAHDDQALLMERSTSGQSLVTMAKHHQDDEATRIMCGAAMKLHNLELTPTPATLVPLSHWFSALTTPVLSNPALIEAATIARHLLNTPQNCVVLHGDIHHANILDFGERGWLVIDPKGLLGERGYDFANIFCNPDIELATQSGRLAHQATIVAKTAGIDRNRLLQWIVAYAGLSAAWHVEDRTNPMLALAIVQIALDELKDQTA